MSFTNPVINSSYDKCWARAYQWKAGGRDKTLEDGTVATVMEAYIKSYNKDKKDNDIFPSTMKIAVVGITTCIGGYFFKAKGDPANARFYSNEVLNTFDQPFKVFKSSKANGTEKVFEDLYSKFKNNRPQGMELQVNIYFYDFTTKEINRFELTGCARNAWFSSKLGNSKSLYEHYLNISAGTLQQPSTTVKFIPPVYALGDSYSVAEHDEIVNSPAYKAYAEWEKKLLHTDLSQLTAETLDQSPEMYDGEDSQEQIIQEDAPMNLDDMPF